MSAATAEVDLPQRTTTPSRLTAAQQQLRNVQDTFIRRWGEMGQTWGINRTMAEIHALLYITAQPLCTDDVMARLNISRGNSSMSLRASFSIPVKLRSVLPSVPRIAGESLRLPSISCHASRMGLREFGTPIPRSACRLRFAVGFGCKRLLELGQELVQIRSKRLLFFLNAGNPEFDDIRLRTEDVNFGKHGYPIVGLPCSNQSITGLKSVVG